MTVHLSGSLEGELERLARVRGQGIEALVEEAVRQYLDAAAITDLSPDDLAQTQAAMAGELEALSAWPQDEVRDADEAG
jgi:predicted transcriptional regulator